MRARHLGIGVVLLAVALAGCGTAPQKVATRSLAPRKVPALTVGPTTLSQGSVWQLNNPGDGAPRESLSITRIAERQITMQLYLSEFGSLFETHITGRTASQQRSVTLSGTLDEAAVSGQTINHRLVIILIPKSPHVMWVTQKITGDPVDSFSQLSFRDTPQ